jgi:FkbM family methyltransferase
MESQVVLWGGFYWPRNDGGGFHGNEPSKTGACYGLTQLFPNVPHTISTYVPSKRVVVQAGGNVGFYVKQYAQMFETVYTFEPVPLLFYCLNKNVENPNVFKFQACVGDTHELVDLGRTVDDNAGSANIIGPGNTPTLRIDDFALPVCDLIHLDIEGYELKALHGAEDTIRRCKPVIALECFDPWLERFETSTQAMEDYLDTLGYTCVGDVKGDRVYWYSERTS